MVKQAENYITSSITQENKIIELANCYMCHVFAVSVYQFHCKSAHIECPLYFIFFMWLFLKVMIWQNVLDQSYFCFESNFGLKFSSVIISFKDNFVEIKKD